MRKLLALGCCVAYLAYGVVAGFAHVHEAADHHKEMRGLHLDHAHVGDSREEPTGHQDHSPPDDSQPQLEARHVGHHEGDALYLTVTAQRSLDSGPRVLPVMIAVGATFDAPNRVSTGRSEVPNQLRGPPQQRPTPSRAPPA
ncbi:MAG: hypothetical protein KJO44_01550 [Gemmatimonadetes bacterium]|nr:hypothetical protein [Gemmatimonadota bacterium]NNK48355.1 hypothetical protein [Gemmatimonadota bacterium]